MSHDFSRFCTVLNFCCLCSRHCGGGCVHQDFKTACIWHDSCCPFGVGCCNVPGWPKFNDGDDLCWLWLCNCVYKYCLNCCCGDAWTSFAECAKWDDEDVVLYFLDLVRCEARPLLWASFSGLHKFSFVVQIRGGYTANERLKRWGWTCGESASNVCRRV